MVENNSEVLAFMCRCLDMTRIGWAGLNVYRVKADGNGDVGLRSSH